MKCNCMFIWTVVYWLLLDNIVVFTAIPTCLTWNTTGTYLNVQCIVPVAKYDIVIVDPLGNDRGHCSLGKTTNCSRSYQYDQLFEDHFEKFTAVTLKTDNQNTEGVWICRHGNEETKSQVSYTEGMVPSINMMISGEVTKINESNTFKLACFSCWVSSVNGVDIYVNNVLEDSIRYHKGQCYHKKSICRQERCTCSAMGKKFTWTFKSDLSHIKFTCAMRFQDTIKSAMVILKANVVYNGSVFLQNQTTNMSVFNQNEHSANSPVDTDKDENKYAGLFGYLVLAIVAMILLGILMILCVRRKKNTTRRKQDVVIGEDNSSESEPLIVMYKDETNQDEFRPLIGVMSEGTKSECEELIAIYKDKNHEDEFRPFIRTRNQTFSTKPVVVRQNASVCADDNSHSTGKNTLSKSTFWNDECIFICSNSKKEEKYSMNLIKYISKYGLQPDNMKLINHVFPDNIWSEIFTTAIKLIIVFPEENVMDNDNFVQLVETAGLLFKYSPLVDILSIVRSKKASLPPWLSEINRFLGSRAEITDTSLRCPTAKPTYGVMKPLIMYQKRLNQISICRKMCKHVANIGLEVLKGWGIEVKKEQMSFHLNTLQSSSQYEPFCLLDLVTYFVTYKSIRVLRFYANKQMDFGNFKLHTHTLKQLTEIFKIFLWMRLDSCWYHYRRNGFGHISYFEEYIKSISLDETPSEIYQHFENHASRINSFTNYPIENKLFRDKLAFAGFFYFNETDYVQCFNCKGCLRTWKITDDPIKRHRENFKTCPFLEHAVRIFSPGKKEPTIKNYTLNELKDRINSFKLFPVKISDIEVERLAEAGFYYSGIAVDIICLSCNVEFADLRNVDDILRLHEKYSPKCPNIVMFKKHTERMLTPNQEGVKNFSRYFEFDVRKHDF